MYTFVYAYDDGKSRRKRTCTLGPYGGYRTLVCALHEPRKYYRLASCAGDFNDAAESRPGRAKERRAYSAFAVHGVHECLTFADWFTNGGGGE